MKIASNELIPILSYPRKINAQAYFRRLEEIDSLNVDSFLQDGNTKIGKFSILGKGGAGIVIKVKGKDNKIYALKIRRVDAYRSSMEREVALHRIANLVGVGPQIYASSENLILMDCIEGWNIGSWLSQQNISINRFLNIVTGALEQCYRLDRANLDHGELSFLNHHLLISKDMKAHIIDFESSSISRPPHNVTSLSHALLLSGRGYELIRGTINIKRNELLHLVRVYKRNKNRENFEKIVNILT